ncbi:MAG: hypothetical protein QMC81_00050 [Thermoanaerobacterales bacterium]|nr:hypothetical protein [Bacillota bacterium]MDI6905867.1 hypothetical protein [Thermoanaerobacterales bacterium]
MRQDLNNIANMATNLARDEQSNAAKLAQMQQMEATAAQQLQRINQMAGALNQSLNQISSLAQQYSATGQQPYQAFGGAQWGQNIPGANLYSGYGAQLGTGFTGQPSWNVGQYGTSFQPSWSAQGSSFQPSWNVGSQQFGFGGNIGTAGNFGNLGNVNAFNAMNQANLGQNPGNINRSWGLSGSNIQMPSASYGANLFGTGYGANLYGAGNLNF